MSIYGLFSDLGTGPVTASQTLIDRFALKDNSHFTQYNYTMCAT